MSLMLCVNSGASARAHQVPAARVGEGAWTVQVDVPETALAALRNKSAGVWLNVRGLRVPEGVKPIVNVFVNLPPGTTSVPTDNPHYVGYLAIVPSKPAPRGGVAVLSGGVLNAGAALSKLPLSERSITVTLAPAEDGRSDAALSADAVYLTVE